MDVLSKLDRISFDWAAFDAAGQDSRDVLSEIASDRAALRALERDPQRVARAEEGCRNNTLYRVAYWLGGFVGASRLDRADVEAALTTAGLASGLEPIEVKATLASGLNNGERSPLPLLRVTAQ